MRRLRVCLTSGWPLLASLLVVALALALFAGLAIEVVEGDAVSFDRPILTWFAQHQSPLLTTIMSAISATADVPFLLATLLLLCVLWWRSRRADWTALVVAIAGAGAFNQIAKQVFERARPTLYPALTRAPGYSFPSGHSQAALAFYGMLAYLLCLRVAPKWRVWICLAAGIWIALVGVSRIYLEVHYPSDVLAAYAITIPWVLDVVFAHRCYSLQDAGLNPGDAQKAIEQD